MFTYFLHPLYVGFPPHEDCSFNCGYVRVDVNDMMVTDAWYNSGAMYQGGSVCED